MDQDERFGRSFREAWTEGVRKYFPGEPKQSYVVRWDEMPEWERNAAIAVHKRAAAFILAGGGEISPEQGGRYISEAWNVEVFRNIENPKPNYVTDWDNLPEWQRLTDIDIFLAIRKFTGRANSEGGAS